MSIPEAVYTLFKCTVMLSVSHDILLKSFSIMCYNWLTKNTFLKHHQIKVLTIYHQNLMTCSLSISLSLVSVWPSFVVFWVLMNAWVVSVFLSAGLLVVIKQMYFSVSHLLLRSWPIFSCGRPEFVCVSEDRMFTSRWMTPSFLFRTLKL